MSAEPPQEARPLIPLEPVGDDKEYREGLAKQGIIIAEDVLCPICGLEAPKEGVHEICIMKQLVEANKKVVESNAGLEGAIGRLTTILDDMSRKQPPTITPPQINVNELVSQIMVGFKENDDTRAIEEPSRWVRPYNEDKPLSLMQRRAQQKLSRRGRR